MQTLARVKRKASGRTSGSVLTRVYDDPVRFNITVIDNEICIVQPYLPSARGVESPTFVARRSLEVGIFNTFAQVFESMWIKAKEVEEQ